MGDEQVKLKNILEKQFSDVKAELLNKEKMLKNLDETNKSSDNTIQQIQNEKAYLQEEISSLKERLVSVEKDQERLEMERMDKETTITEEKRIRNETAVEIRKMKQQEIHLLEQISEKEVFERKLRDDVLSNESIISSLKIEIVDYEKKLSAKDTEITNLKSSLSLHQKSKGEVDMNLKQLRKEKNDLTNQLTSISLKRDALEDEYIHTKEEYQILKEQLELFHKSFSARSGANNQLSEEILDKKKVIKELEVKLKNLEAELEREIVTSEDWRLECEASDERNKELTLENDKKSESIKQLNNTIVSLKSRLFEANRNLSEYQEKT